MLRNVRQPFLIKIFGGEITLHEIVTHWCSGLLIAALTCGNHRLNASDFAQPPYPPLRNLIAEVMEIISEHPIPALRVFFVEFMQHADQVFLLDLTS